MGLQGPREQPAPPGTQTVASCFFKGLFSTSQQRIRASSPRNEHSLDVGIFILFGELKIEDFIHSFNNLVR